MILAGLDEAGYGPLLGPLVVGCCAFRVADPGAEELPCVWKRLRRIASKKKTASGKKLHFNDSKIVYSPSIGLKPLERSVLALSHATYGAADDLPSLLRQVAPHVLDDLRGYPWYQPAENERFPLEHQVAAVRILGDTLSREMEQNGAKCVHLAARVVCERQFNRLVSATRNKASVLFSTGAIHLDYLMNHFGQQGLTIFCDRQGGREHYGSLLRLMFDAWALEIIDEREAASEYHLTRDGHVVRILFREKAEAQCLPVAAASMLCKYLREALMRRFNAFWAIHMPDVPPTAGYYKDGGRFLRDIDVKRREMGITDDELVRLA